MNGACVGGVVFEMKTKVGNRAMNGTSLVQPTGCRISPLLCKDFNFFSGVLVMPSYVYILRSATSGRHLIGSTNDLHGKIDGHNKFSARTSQVDPWECVYVEVCDNINAARHRERFLKSVDGVDEKIRILYSVPKQQGRPAADQ